ITHLPLKHRRRRWLWSGNPVSQTSWQMCCFHFGRRTSSRLPPRRVHSFGQNTHSCRRSYRTGDWKPPLRVFLEVILGGRNFCVLLGTNKGSYRSTKTFACRTIPIAHNAHFPNRWQSGCELQALKGLQSYIGVGLPSSGCNPL